VSTSGTAGPTVAYIFRMILAQSDAERALTQLHDVTRMLTLWHSEVADILEDANADLRGLRGIPFHHCARSSPRTRWSA